MLRVVTAARLAATGALLLVAVVIALWLIPSHDVLLLPDVAHPVAPYVHVAGGREPRNGGGIYFVDVKEETASLLEQLLGGLHSGATLYPESQILTPGVSAAQQHLIDTEEMRTSQQVGAAVALRTAGKRVTVTRSGALVVGVEPGFPAAGRLVPTDVIVSVDGSPVRSQADVTRAMRGQPVGSRVTFVVRRGVATRTVVLTTVPASPGSRRGVVGVYLDQAVRIHLPVRVSIDLRDVGGPSAGLAFALDVLQQLGRDVDRGYKIAATGELSLSGQVGPIGGIKQKTIGAREAGVDAFLVPAGQNARDARRYARGLRIIPVRSFRQALLELATLPEKR